MVGDHLGYRLTIDTRVVAGVVDLPVHQHSSSRLPPAARGVAEAIDCRERVRGVLPRTVTESLLEVDAEQHSVVRAEVERLGHAGVVAHPGSSARWFGQRCQSTPCKSFERWVGAL